MREEAWGMDDVWWLRRGRTPLVHYSTVVPSDRKAEPGPRRLLSGVLGMKLAPHAGPPDAQTHTQTHTQTHARTHTHIRLWTH